MNQLKLLFLFICFLISASCTANNIGQHEIKDIIESTIQPLAQKYTIPGMAVGITIDGKNYFYNYGIASRETQQPITNETLFEIGSIGKAFTATLVSYAQINGKLSFNDSASKYLPSLRGSNFENISLLNLGTHTAGNLPLQVPDGINNFDQLMDYFKHWKPAYAAGTYRVYSNLSIGMLGMIVAETMHESFENALEKKLFPGLGMAHSYINVPMEQVENYAQGYTKTDVPIRLKPGILASETYAVKSNTTDLIRFIEINMQLVKLDKRLQRAVTNTHMGYFKSGDMTQDLIWEQYAYPVNQEQLLTGNSEKMIYQATKVIRLSPPLQPQTNVLINKTGSTNGFAAYIAFIPAKKIGIVILANKNYPIKARVSAAYQILTELDQLSMR